MRAAGLGGRVAPALTAVLSGLVAAGPGAAPPVVVQRHLDRTGVRPGPIEGVVDLVHTTAPRITVETCATDGWRFVALVNRHVAFQPAFALVACPPSIHLRPGSNRFPVTALTTYEEGGFARYPRRIRGRGTKGRASIPELPRGTSCTRTAVVGGPRHSELPRPTTVEVT